MDYETNYKKYRIAHDPITTNNEGYEVEYPRNYILEVYWNSSREDVELIELRNERTNKIIPLNRLSKKALHYLQDIADNGEYYPSKTVEEISL